MRLARRSRARHGRAGLADRGEPYRHGERDGAAKDRRSRLGGRGADRALVAGMMAQTARIGGIIGTKVKNEARDDDFGRHANRRSHLRPANAGQSEGQYQGCGGDAPHRAQDPVCHADTRPDAGGPVNGGARSHIVGTFVKP